MTTTLPPASVVPAPPLAVAPGNIALPAAGTVTWCRSLSEWQALEPEWNELLARSEAETIFLTWEWLEVWWRHFGGGSEPWIPVLRSPDGVLRGVGPLKRRRIRGRLGSYTSVEFLGYGGAANPDHLNFIFERGWERSGLEAFLDAMLARRDEWDLLQLTDVPEDSVVARTLPRAAVGRGLCLRSYRHTVCPYLLLPATYKELLASVSTSLRKDIRKGFGKLSRLHAVDVVSCESPDEVERGFRELAHLHQLRMEESERGGNFRRDTYAAFHRDLMHQMARLGRLELRLVSVDGQPAAANYGFRYKGVLSGYQMGLDPKWYRYSLGSMLLGELVRSLIEEGYREVDMLRGRSAWKYRWTKRERTHAAFLIHRRGLRASRAKWSSMLAGSVGVVLKRLLPADTFEALQNTALRAKGKTTRGRTGAESGPRPERRKTPR